MKDFRKLNVWEKTHLLTSVSCHPELVSCSKIECRNWL